MNRRFKYTLEMESWMKANYRLPLGKLTALFNQHFSVNRSHEAINGFRKRRGLRTGRSGQFCKGNRPFNTGTKGLCKPNAGSFKQGQPAWNKRDVGAERINVDGYTELKVAEPNIWRPKHHVIWEKHHGKRPKGTLLTFKDGDPQNCQIDNLLMITHKEHGVLNRYYHAVSTDHKQTAINLTRIKIAVANQCKKTRPTRNIKRGQTHA
ncbi:HNH endonuclease signature motif containing protein [Xenorhabdus littoralis]|uniref:HNH endonuclease signature motif containing protein n=1 Tax=Xenorhabdus littoralis TaxID=2582835 RepID=UPI0029E7DD7D|nr:HNH endonuclease signature motif containing protein [Xenorhabdus sp. psl]MDX7990843.1 HNH endonuclease [Xenorhabdus sp. psl]